MKKNTHKYRWNLSLLYKNSRDPQIEKDLKNIESVCIQFEKKYKHKNFIDTPQSLYKALTDYESLSETINGSKPWWYFALLQKLDSRNNRANAISTIYEQRITHASNRITFFELAIARIPKKDHAKFLSYPKLIPFRYMLEKIFKHAQHNLSEGEEQLASLLSQTSYTMWEEGQSRVLNQKTIFHNGEELPIAKAVSLFSDLPTRERREVYKKIIDTFKTCADFADSEINAIYTYKKIMDERRGYAQPYSATVLSYENKEKTVGTLVSLVTKNFSISHRFYRLHAKILGDTVTYADKNVKAGEIKRKFSFDESVSIVRGAFEKIDPQYTEMLDSFLAHGQIDAYPQKGKSGGAFCWSTGLNPVYVLLNHTDDIRSVETLAHEMGHGIHYTLSKQQPSRYRDFSIATAEVASTFFEQVVSAELEHHLSADEKIVFLHNKIMGDISTIFRQIACFNFELELHTEIRAKGMVPKEDIAKMLAQHMKSYLGKAVSVSDDDGYTFVSWSHIRNFFYVYSYAFGQLVSRALYEKWKADPHYAQQIKQFLSAGRSLSPEDIFKNIGINVTDPAFFELGLKSIERDIAHLEKLVHERKKK